MCTNEKPTCKACKTFIFIFKFSKCSCHPLFVLLIYFKQLKNKKEKEINGKMRFRKEGNHAMAEDSIFSAGFFEDKIKALQVQHTFENNYLAVVHGNVRKIKCQPTTMNSILIKNVVIWGQFMSLTHCCRKEKIYCETHDRCYIF